MKKAGCQNHGGVQGIVGNSSGPARKGMTWAKASHDHSLGTDRIGCRAQGNCDPYRGDTPCDRSLPVLCIRKDGAPNPGTPTGTYAGWAGGHLSTTLPVRGDALLSFDQASARCAEAFGSGWAMAQFHDGGGWNLDAYGNVREDTRFWVYIRDQKANCWDS